MHISVEILIFLLRYAYFMLKYQYVFNRFRSLNPFKKNKRKTLIKKWYSDICAMKSDVVYARSKRREEEIPRVTTKHGLAD